MTVERWILAASAALALAGPLDAQTPGTDVWIAPIIGRGSAMRLGAPVNATHRPGYDNQPSFTNKGDAVLYTVQGEGQTEIWRFALPKGKNALGAPVQLTHTPESEYSATVTPDGKSYSVIRVEADSTQRLWRFPLDGVGDPSLVLERIKPVGYHVWAGDHTLVIFVLGSPATLQIADDRSGNAEVKASNIGRALAKVPGRDVVTFLQQEKDSASWITELDIRTGATTRLMQPPPRADYHVWTPDGVLLAAGESKIYRWESGAWRVLADLAGAGVRRASRLAVSPRGDWLAFVADDAPKP
jgi:hypothetical protein